MPFACLAFFLTSCAQPRALVYKDVADFRVHKVELSTITVVVGLRFYNPNHYGLSLKNGDLNAFINDRPLGKAILDERVVVPANDTFLIPVTIQADTRTIFQNALDALTNKEVTIKLDGTVRAGKGGIFIPIPVHYVGAQRLNL